MKKFLLLLLSLIAAALLGYYCTYKMNASALIEQDIINRSQAALDQQNMAWVNLSVDGRDITLTGDAPNSAAKKAADQVVRVSGYNIIHNQLKIGAIDSKNTLTPSSPIETNQKNDSSNPSSKPIVVSKLTLPTATSNNRNNPSSRVVGKEEKATKKQIRTCQDKFNHILQTPIRFKSSSAVVQKTSFVVLNKIASAAKECAHFDLKIHGHTDSSGNAFLNKKLSQGRANAIRKHLINKKIDDKRLFALGHGASIPVASNRTRTGRSRNRRIEITVEEKQ